MLKNLYSAKIATELYYTGGERLRVVYSCKKFAKLGEKYNYTSEN